MSKTGFRINIIFLMSAFFLVACSPSGDKKNGHKEDSTSIVAVAKEEKVIKDCNYTFEEALEGSRVPESLRGELVIFGVRYISTDGKVHEGQIVCNRAIEEDVKAMFEYMKERRFVIEKVIPAVKYGWDDNKSMDDNNTYCFNYRNISYSFHATGMAIDINPKFNPQRWKGEWRQLRRDRPIGAVYDTTRNGTFVAGSDIVEEWRRRGFSWGHYMSRKSDDHHFQKGSLGSMPKVYSIKGGESGVDGKNDEERTTSLDKFETTEKEDEVRSDKSDVKTESSKEYTESNATKVSKEDGSTQSLKEKMKARAKIARERAEAMN